MFLTQDEYDRQHASVVTRQDADHEQLVKLVAQIATLRGIVAFLGLPGLAALAWIIIAQLGHPGTP